jgi:SAM-dependent methyltransferase
MEETIEEFLKLIPADSAILDLGCGSGRDSLYFLEEGFDVTAIDGSRQMCELAEIEIGQDVVHHMMFDELEFEDVFDGVWACASLLHVKKTEINGIIDKISKSLVKDGVLYMSFKQGEFEGMRDGRYYADYEVSEIKNIIKAHQELEIIDIYTKRRNKDDEHTWINVFVRKNY